MRMIYGLVPIAFGLAACQTYPSEPYGPQGYPSAEPYPAPYPGPPVDQGPYRASGTEPFWDLTISRDLVFTDRGNNIEVVEPTPAVRNSVTGQAYNGQRLRVNIVRSQCSDGMSDRTYPDTVQVFVDNRLYRGCGASAALLTQTDERGSPVGPPAGIAPPLERTRWRVVAINGRPVAPGDHHVDFDSGQITARFGCNSIGASYTQNGSTLDAGPVRSTRMMCQDIHWETQGTAILGQPMNVAMRGPNRLTLSNGAGTIDLARR